MRKRIALFFICGWAALAADQSRVGYGNRTASEIASGSPLVQSAGRFLSTQASTIRDASVRKQTTEAIGDPQVCIASRANLSATAKGEILRRLRADGLLSPEDSDHFPGGEESGVFPPVASDGSDCPRLPQTFLAAPGSEFHGHHSYPGGLAVHEELNIRRAIQLATIYRHVYGLRPSDLQPDLIVEPPIWHDWAKTLVFQWNSDGTESAEFHFGGNGRTDNNGAPGDSRTGAHHLLGLAEVMKRRFPPQMVIAQACAHSAPTLGNEYKVVNWLRAAAIVAQVDPVADGYLARDGEGRLHLPGMRLEYIIHTLSDDDFSLSIPALEDVDQILAEVAPRFGYRASDVTAYNNKFRNVVLSHLSAERLFVVNTNGGVEAVVHEIASLRDWLK